ncbi:MAG: ribosomal L7Ae/L30e/S12e/Gadd45 family protein [Alicyclobacillus sp.]|nr:ribosomal L7Ae/L30e/S12e/Gadd45 family protein [Alicyclobacillus sp.]
MGLLGLAKRARGVVAGTDVLLDALAAGRVRLVLLASDAGSNVAKKVRDKCAFYGIQVLVCFDRNELGRALGRGPTVVAGVTDPGFTGKLLQYTGEFFGGEAFGETSGVRVREATEHVEQGDPDHPQPPRRARGQPHERDG